MNFGERIRQNRDLLWSIGLSTLVILLLLASTWLLIFLVQRLFGVFFVVMLGVLIAFILNPLVKLLKRLSIPHLLSAILSFLAFLAIFVLLFYLLVPAVVQELFALKDNLPSIMAAVEQASQSIDAFLRNLGLGLSFDQVYTQLQETIRLSLGDLLAQAVAYGVGLANLLSQGLFVLLIAFFLTKDWPYLRDRLRESMSRSMTPRSWELLTGIGRTVGRYLRSLLLVATVVGVLVGVGTALLGIPYAWVLGILGFIGELIPYFGPFVSLIVALILSLGRPLIFLLYVTILYAGIQAFQNYFLSPLVMADQMGFHPITVIIAVLVGGALFGIWGVILAVPLLSVGRHVIQFFFPPSTPKPSERSSADEQQPA
jgi:predicted PurR-regulated permease PerM